MSAGTRSVIVIHWSKEAEMGISVYLISGFLQEGQESSLCIRTDMQQRPSEEISRLLSGWMPWGRMKLEARLSNWVLVQ